VAVCWAATVWAAAARAVWIAYTSTVGVRVAVGVHVARDVAVIVRVGVRVAARVGVLVRMGRAVGAGVRVGGRGSGVAIGATSQRSQG
jgi:hypothetical protein